MANRTKEERKKENEMKRISAELDKNVDFTVVRVMSSMSSNTDSNEPPPMSTEGSATVSTEGSASVSTEESATVSTERSATVSTEGSATASTEGSATVSTEGSATVSTEGSATVSTEESATVSTPTRDLTEILGIQHFNKNIIDF